MFTGIIENIGKITSASAKPGGMTLTVCLDSTTISPTVAANASEPISGKNRGQLPVFAKSGDSIAVNGVCLTGTSLAGNTITFDVSAETLNRTTLKNCRPGQSINLERAMSADARFGGHIVQGHIDGVGKIISIRKQGDFAVFAVESPAEILDQIVVKGSVALDGVSLTVASITGKTFTVALIPETLSRTIWGKSKVGDAVNIETDILLKAVQKQLEKIQPNNPGLSEDKLREMGF
jgi:riboflavin synthase